jgi:hypothetical protein
MRSHIAWTHAPTTERTPYVTAYGTRTRTRYGRGHATVVGTGTNYMPRYMQESYLATLLTRALTRHPVAADESVRSSARTVQWSESLAIHA